MCHRQFPEAAKAAHFIIFAPSLMNHPVTIGFSPCPNDTFIFCALVNGMIDCEGLQFKPVIEDVESLNQKAMVQELDVTKLSMNAYAHAAQQYLILKAGSALGRNCGPLLVSKKKYTADEVKSLKIAIPGKFTTANLLLSIFFPDAQHKTELVFSEIEDAVLNGTFDAGLIIHENRFTYQQKGLQKIADLGELWEEKTQSPIPLGCIAVKRNLSAELQKKIDRLIHQSIRFAFAHPQRVMDYVKNYSQEMDESVMKQHIALYVNEYSLDLGEEGKKAIELLLKKGNENNLLPLITDTIFIS